MTKFADIIERLEKSTGPDRVLDARIAAEIEPHHFDAHGFTPIRPIPAFAMDKGGDCIRFEGGGIMGFHCFPRVTGSTDEAIAISERVIALEGRKLICFFCAGGQLTPWNADKGSPDYHPKAKIDNSVTVGWMAHIRFYNADGSSVGADDYSHGKTAPLAILLALFRALEAKEGG